MAKAGKGVRCPYCGLYFQRRLLKHIVDKHSKKVYSHGGETVVYGSFSSNESDQLTAGERRVVSAVRYAERMDKDLAGAASWVGGVKLDTKFSKRFDRGGICKQCGLSSKPLWRFQESSKGEVFICSRCKTLLLDRSFGSSDALDHAVTGGSFEGNPKKH